MNSDVTPIMTTMTIVMSLGDGDDDSNCDDNGAGRLTH